MTTNQSGPSEQKPRRSRPRKTQPPATDPASSPSAPVEKLSPQNNVIAPPPQPIVPETLKPAVPPVGKPENASASPSERKISTESKPALNTPLTPGLPKETANPVESKPIPEPPIAVKPLVSLGDALDALKAEIPIASTEPEIPPNKPVAASVPVVEAKPSGGINLPPPAAPAPKVETSVEIAMEHGVAAASASKPKEVAAIVPAPEIQRELKRVEAQRVAEKVEEQKKEVPKIGKTESAAPVILESHTKILPEASPKIEPVREVKRTEAAVPQMVEDQKRTGQTSVPPKERGFPSRPEPEATKRADLEISAPSAPAKVEPPQSVPAPAREPRKVEPPKAEDPKPQPPPLMPNSPPRPRVAPMFVVQITPELAPVAKVGGLADVVFGLSRELEIRGNAVEVILPKYDCMKYHHIWGLSVAYEHLQVPWFGGSIDTTVWFGFVHGRKCFFIDPHSQDRFFNRGAFYGQNDDVLRFAFFCRAATEFLLKMGKHPDIIHCHDWQTALVPVLLWEMYQHLGLRHPRVCFTIHNFKHQGVTGEQVLRATGLNRPEYFFNYDRMRDNHNAQAINLLKSGIVYSNFVTTVSPRHAWEAKDGEQGFGLEPTLHIHHRKYGGVLNGLDYEMFNPETDRHIPSHYNVNTIQKKYDNKRALRNRFWLADNAKPIVAFIGRLDPQKGPELVKHAIFYALQHGAQFVLLGESPDRNINNEFWGLKRHLNDSPDCHLEIGYSDELAHLIYAGADMMVVPSRFEPCGLTQLISLRYGTVPIVRSVGGLADTVFDKDYSDRPLHERNGYVFRDADNAGIESALNRAISCYYKFPDHFRHLMVNAMKSDYSWNHPGEHYVNIYDYIRDK